MSEQSRTGQFLRHGTMIRNFHLADLFTIANGFCGVGAVFEALKFLKTDHTGHIYIAASLIAIALVFDVLDGRIARWRHSASPLGRELDSLADVISFGVAPAATAFAVGISSRLDQILLIYFVVCGLSRLARYNVTAESLAAQTGKIEYFEGTPITTSIVPLGLLILAFYRETLYPANLFGVEFHWPAWLFFISGCLMISKTLKIPKP